MISQSDVDKLIRQTKQYEFADGLRDLQIVTAYLALSVRSEE